LAVVDGIVKQSGGITEVFSELGTGTTFKIYLPTIGERPAKIIPVETAPIPRGLETILLVEDEDGVRRFTSHVLQSFGYQVLSASSGTEALTLLAAKPTTIHLLVSDVVMPKMSGRELAEVLRTSQPDLKVLFLSGYTDDAVLRHGVNREEFALLQKPFLPNSLGTKVREVLDNPRSKRN
jgi:two-component system, cell cycle sensor histidine kinase and response regulator CckA